MQYQTDKHVLANGMVLLGEPMEAVQSAAFGFMIPAGAAVLRQGCCGAANVIADWLFRGAGNYTSRRLSDKLDGLGLHRSSSVDTSHIAVGAALETGNLPEALKLYADIIQRPRLTDQEFQPAKQLAIEGVRALDDNPRQNVMLKLREQFYPAPLGRSIVGSINELENLSAEDTRQIIKHNFNLSNTIFAVAGKYDFESVAARMDDMFQGQPRELPQPVRLAEEGAKYRHIQNEGAQVHIGLMTGTVTPADDDYYNARVAVAVLSGGMSARLFTEVREKRGLCYAIGARYHGLKEAAGIMCYAGTTPDKAQETVDVIMSEFSRLGDGISEEELHRAKIGLESSLILQSESSTSRAGAIAGDYYMLGRIRSLDEIKTKIEETTVDSVLQFLRTYRFREFTVVSIGPKKVTVK